MIRRATLVSWIVDGGKKCGKFGEQASEIGIYESEV